MSKNWEDEAENWVRWARTPGHDAYWSYAANFFDEVLPHSEGKTLEVGCGEGRVSRDLRDRGHEVVAVDASPTLVTHAASADAHSQYLSAAAERLPFPASTFSLAVAYNSLQNVNDLPRSVQEIGRVLEPSGQFCLCIAHPFSDAGRFGDDTPQSPFIIKGSYYGKRRIDEKAEHDALEITFHGWGYPLEDYARSLEDAGFLIELVREPLPNPAMTSFARWRRIPLFLSLRCIKREGASGLAGGTSKPTR
jgi:SAM-dependent methyltransferase